MLRIEGLTAEIDGKAILRGIDLEVPSGELHAIMGPNGSGKSTLSYVLSGREGYEITGGSVTFDGVDLLAMEPEERAAAGACRRRTASGPRTGTGRCCIEKARRRGCANVAVQSSCTCESHYRAKRDGQRRRLRPLRRTVMANSLSTLVV
jgi:ABC-type glutathione transport system ATPase component